MIKVYISNLSKEKIGGGFSFLGNFRKAMDGKVEFVNNWRDCDIIFIFGVTAIDKNEIYEAVDNGKKLVLRVDNIPLRSRNKRQDPPERLRDLGKIASRVIYQSKWSRQYAGYFSGPGDVIYNAVDNDIFNRYGRIRKDGRRFLYANFNDNPNKRFEEALYWFDLEYRKDPNSVLTIVGNVPRVYIEKPELYFDLPAKGKVEYLGIIESPEEMAKIYKKNDVLIFPSFADSCPNTVAEAIACGCAVYGVNAVGGTTEVLHDANKCHCAITDDYKLPIYEQVDEKDTKTLEQMGQEYLNVFKELCPNK